MRIDLFDTKTGLPAGLAAMARRRVADVPDDVVEAARRLRSWFDETGHSGSILGVSGNPVKPKPDEPPNALTEEGLANIMRGIIGACRWSMLPLGW